MMLNEAVRFWMEAPYQYLKSPLIILAIIPIAIFIFALLRKGFVQLKSGDFEPGAMRRRIFLRYFIFVIRTLIVLAVLIAIASPFIETETIVRGDMFLNLLVDNTSSFTLFDHSIAPKIKAEIARELRVEQTIIGTGDRSALGDSVLANLQKDGTMLMITDGNNNLGADLGDVALYAAKLNATINAVKLEPIQMDLAVTIKGPAKILEGIKSIFTAEVSGASKTLPEYHLTIEIDGQKIVDETTSALTTPFERVFTSGYHTIKATISIDDYFEENNVYYKAVRVVRKPDLFFWTKEDSPTLILFEQMYKVTKGDGLPNNLDEFHAIVINNLNKNDVGEEITDKLSEFVSDGNGLLIIGGDDSFEKGAYKDSGFETLLPVFVGAPAKEEGDTNIVLVLDISGSTGTAVKGEKAVDIEKAQAISILSDLKPSNRVGVVAFNAQAFVIEPLTYLYEKTGLAERISQLKDGGGTLISAGLQEAIDMLKPREGSKNIILISDGMTQLFSAAEELAKIAAKMGVRIYTVGIGARTNRQIMQKLALMTSGIYFDADQSKRLKLLFGEPEDEERTSYNLVPLDANHFITAGLELKAVITGFNYIVPKSTANLLVTTDAADPILTVWRYGLGRTATLTTDDGRKYAGQLLAKENSVLLARTMNWVIGDPSRKEEYYIDVEDTRMGEPTKLIVKSPVPPKADGLRFFKIGENLYRASIIPEEPGFHTVADAIFGVNYKEEYEKLGFSEELEDITRATGGKLYKPDEMEKFLKDVKSRSIRTIIKKIDLRWPFVVFAIALFLFEVAVRKLSRKHRVYK